MGQAKLRGVPDLDWLFSERGPLAMAVREYRARPFQVEMARAVADAIARHGVLVAEAGTGTGKTFAYLVPALVSGGKVIVSTGTKTLQDQLFDRDIPTVRNALKVPVTVALLKGRTNYVCRHHLEHALAEARFASRGDALDLSRIERFARVSATGDRADCADVPETSPAWGYATSTRENCLGSQCAHYDACFVMNARRQALAADVVVVNHHLFFADLALRDEGAGELLPACNTVIFDEAHQLPETASLFFGETVSTSQYLELARDTRVEAAVTARESSDLQDAAQALEKAARDLRLVFGEESGRLPLRALERNPSFQPALAAVLQRLDDFTHILAAQASRSEALERCWQRALSLAEHTERWRSAADAAAVRWVELYSRALHLHATPLSIAETFRECMGAQPRAWIFTSATLSVAGDFSHYRGELGLGEAASVSWQSPFDYERQALLYVPAGLPEPNTREHTPAVIAAALPLIEACGGRTFLLFTSLRAMREARVLLEQEFEKRALSFPLLVQGEGPRTELLQRFRALGNAVLIGSQSFWEGVDVRGEALSLVVIDKLPFGAPDDPVLAARIDRLNGEGRNAFLEYQLPEAVITLKQGAGRLIRDETDRGVLAICDTRLVTRSYGRRILKSLPRMRRTRDAAEALAFLDAAFPAPQCRQASE
ncbi:MAG TPA: ATP-dependent DNA helicase [Burkholderiales bacterium]|nr:ATP-dependent DNA helicase [Burkholderiales bacterium]